MCLVCAFITAALLPCHNKIWFYWVYFSIFKWITVFRSVSQDTGCGLPCFGHCLNIPSRRCCHFCLCVWQKYGSLPLKSARRKCPCRQTGYFFLQEGTACKGQILQWKKIPGGKKVVELISEIKHCLKMPSTATQSNSCKLTRKAVQSSCGLCVCVFRMQGCEACMWQIFMHGCDCDVSAWMSWVSCVNECGVCW